VTVDVAPITLFADRIQVGQVLTNLVANAYDAMGDQGSLRLTASINGQAAVIEVEDDGPGIEHALAERVFEPFYTTRQRGTGLGLAIVRRLVEGLGGSIRLDTDAPHGARFLVTLPCRKGPKAREL
jgi:signal transduction histidine kinase